MGAAARPLISDAVHNGGNQHFFFLPPVAPAPTTSGTFDATLSPEVRICAYSEVEGRCTADVATFNAVSGNGSETVRLDAAQEHYVVNWHTDDLLADSDTYRIQVLVDSRLLGYADVRVVDSGKEVKSVDTGAYLPLKDGRTLVITFRIEQGALSTGGGTIAVGRFNSCRLAAGGAAYCSGGNYCCQLGIGTCNGVYLSPVAVSGGHAFQSISVGTHGSSHPGGIHICGVTTSGDAYCWGQGDHGELGNGLHPWRQTTPAKVLGGLTFQSISAGLYHTCGLTVDGKAYCWGYGLFGELGHGLRAVRETTPVAVAGGHTFQSLEAGLYTSCGITTTGAAYCWGNGGFGQLGNGTYTAIQTTPVPVAGGHTFAALSMGEWHVCGVTTGGQAYCWGRGVHGERGDGSFGRYQSLPAAVLGGHTFTSVDAGAFHTCGVTTAGAAYCWGHNFQGQLGAGFSDPPSNSPTGHATPLAVVGGHLFEYVVCGGFHSCGVTTGGQVRCWGYNGDGQFGNGSAGWPVRSPVEAMVLPSP